MREWQPFYSVRRSSDSMMANASNLSQEYLEIIRQHYEGTRFYETEIMGHLGEPEQDGS